MKFRTRVLMILVCVIAFSCDEKKTEPAEVENTEIVEEKSRQLILDVDLETSKPDDLDFLLTIFF